jgi:hypothetical protein
VGVVVVQHHDGRAGVHGQRRGHDEDPGGIGVIAAVEVLGARDCERGVGLVDAGVRVMPPNSPPRATSGARPLALFYVLAAY